MTGNANDTEWQTIGDPTISQTVGTGGDFTYGINPQARANIAAVLFRPDPAVTPAPPTATPPITPPRKVRKCKRHKRPKGLADTAKRRCKRKPK